MGRRKTQRHTSSSDGSKTRTSRFLQHDINKQDVCVCDLCISCLRTLRTHMYSIWVFLCSNLKNKLVVVDIMIRFYCKPINNINLLNLPIIIFKKDPFFEFS